MLFEVQQKRTLEIFMICNEEKWRKQYHEGLGVYLCELLFALSKSVVRKLNSRIFAVDNKFWTCFYWNKLELFFFYFPHLKNRKN